MIVWPKTEIIAPRRIRLLSDFSYEWETPGYPPQILIVPRGFTCDGGSVPKALHWFLGWDEILPAAVPHDWLYAYQGIPPLWSHQYRDGHRWSPADYAWSRQDTDRLFGRLLEHCDIGSTKRKLAYAAVRVGGRGAWKKQTWHPGTDIFPA